MRAGCWPRLTGPTHPLLTRFVAVTVAEESYGARSLVNFYAGEVYGSGTAPEEDLLFGCNNVDLISYSSDDPTRVLTVIPERVANGARFLRYPPPPSGYTCALHKTRPHHATINSGTAPNEEPNVKAHVTAVRCKGWKAAAGWLTQVVFILMIGDQAIKGGGGEELVWNYGVNYPNHYFTPRSGNKRNIEPSSPRAPTSSSRKKSRV